MIKLPLLAEIAKEAGDKIAMMQPEIAAHAEQEKPATGEFQMVDPNIQVVTEADHASNRIIRERLKQHFPGIAILSEESTDEEKKIALKARDRFDTDPLDNTRGYIRNRPTFSINIGRITDGVPVEGAVYFPAKKELYYTNKGKAYWQSGDQPPKEINVSRFPLRSPIKVVVGYNEQQLSYLGNRSIDVQRHTAQMRTCMVARGEYDVSGINRGNGFNSWDLAGPHAVLLAAGGDIVTPAGERIRYGQDTYKLPEHIAGSEDALALCVPGFARASKVAMGGV